MVCGIELEFDHVAHFGKGHVGFKGMSALEALDIDDKEGGACTFATPIVWVTGALEVLDGSVELGAALSVEVMVVVSLAS